MGKYKIVLDRKVLKLLGSQLYGDTPSVIAELVANSYDADAKSVWITLDIQNDNIIIEDDGKGMSTSEINNSFLNIGYNKRVDKKTTDLGRPIMGRKGIGKLAVFSLANDIKVLSSKDGKVCGCSMDFIKITTENTEPVEIYESDINFSKDKLSSNNTGTRIELCGVKKRVSYGYRFIISKLIRMFDVNDDSFKIRIRKNEEEYKELHRAQLNYFSIMDNILTIGSEHHNKGKVVESNGIPLKYKSIKTYEDYLNEQPKSKNKLRAFPYNISVEDIKGNTVTIEFSIHGWIGTVDSLPHLREIEQRIVGEDSEDEEKITVNDNRISLYSRGKLGEYDILAKIKSNSNNEAYAIGELFVDIFENDELADMAISNRRGYEENDNRYIEVIKVAKKLLQFVVKQKTEISKLNQKDLKQKQNIDESEQIKKEFLSNLETKRILDEKLNEVEKSVIQEANIQFVRAVNLQNATKKIFISHKEIHKIYGKFIVSVLEEYGVDVVSSVIFTSDRRLGIPQGKDIYDYLKQCFREDLMVIFLFSKAFYDSNICIAEVGAAWATNKNCLNAIVDIGFSDIEKPSNNALSSIQFKNLRTEDQVITLYQFFETILRIGLQMDIDEDNLHNSIKKVLNLTQYEDTAIDNPVTFTPTRKFLPYIKCSSCNNVMELVQKENKLYYQCSNVSCTNKVEALIK